MVLPTGALGALYELFDFCIDNGEAKLKETEHKYSGSLDLRTIYLLHDILEDEFYVSQYHDLTRHEDLYYQGLRDEVGEGPSPADDGAWRALLEVARAFPPKADDDDAPSPHDELSHWLYLGTYYFGHDSDSTAYQTFIEKVGTFVKHVGVVMGQSISSTHSV